MDNNQIKKIIEKCMEEIEKIDSDYDFDYDFDFDYFTVGADCERFERIDHAKATAFDEIVRIFRLG